MSSKHHELRDTPKDQAKEDLGANAHGSDTDPQQPSQASGDKAPQEETTSATAAPGEASTREAALEAEMKTLTAEVASLRDELSVVNDKYLRKLADDANFRKRMAREKEDGQRFAVATLLVDLIPILDDFDRAVASAETARDYVVLHDGVVLIRRQLGTMLETKYGLKRLESLGKPFDPNHHEAVAMVTGETDEAMVDEEFLPGYGLHERILRTAKVKVRMPAPKEDGSAARAADSDSVDPASATKTPTDVEE